jgi:hypothetical protein
MDKKMAIRNGVWDVELKGREDFLAFVNDHFIAAGESNQRSPTKDRSCADKYVWRGEPEGTKHPLVSSFDRELQKWGRGERLASLKRHRQAFLYAVRGRTEELGFSVAELKHYVRAGTLNENHLWAFGQHYGLATPLLDWTASPFVAAFFACEKKQDGAQIVYGLRYEELCTKSEQQCKHSNPCRPVVKYFSPMSSEIGRLTGQQGLFTLAEDGRSVINWVEQLFAGERETPILIKIRIVANMRTVFLARLNLMGINHRSIYPDVDGAAKFCNMGLEIGPGYADALVPNG